MGKGLLIYSFKKHKRRWKSKLASSPCYISSDPIFEETSFIHEKYGDKGWLWVKSTIYPLSVTIYYCIVSSSQTGLCRLHEELWVFLFVSPVHSTVPAVYFIISKYILYGWMKQFIRVFPIIPYIEEVTFHLLSFKLQNVIWLWLGYMIFKLKICFFF